MASWAPRDGNWSGQVHPARLQQVSWTNPLDQQDPARSGTGCEQAALRLFAASLLPGHPDIPRVVEFGSTVGMDDVSPAVNAQASNGDQRAAVGQPEQRASAARRNIATSTTTARARRSRTSPARTAPSSDTTAATSRRRRHNTAGDTRLTYRYDTPAATCLTTTPISCGNTSLYFPSDPTNLARRPVPTRVTINTGIADIESKVKYSALYLQDQWTLKRFTLSGAIRYDHATSNYIETCIGPDRYVPGARTAGRLPARPATARRRPTASPTTTSRRGGPWRGTSLAPARRR